MAWVWPRPPDEPPFTASLPRFSEVNLAQAPLGPGEETIGYHCAEGFTRFYSSVAADTPLEIRIEFSNDEVVESGKWITDADLPGLHYDVLERTITSAPGDLKGNWILILGRWVRVRVKNTGSVPTANYRVYIRGSVF
ncbi:MAG TPA: hypothetical protein VLV86_03435 [Vicinamibacterales bacterium]|nr:hypothetical protein [Vicinamibacterales bacterium]